MAQLNMKKLGAALMNRGGGGAVGGAVNPLLDKVLPSTMKPVIKLAIKAGAGALAPELVPKIKIADHAGAGLVGAAISDFLRENVEMFKSGAPSTAGIGEDLDRGYVIDEDRVDVSGNEETISGDGDTAPGVSIEGEEENPLS